MNSGEVIIHLIRPADRSREESWTLLTDTEKTKAARFRFEKDAVHWMACRAALRQILGERFSMSPLKVPLITAEYGKPVLASPYEGLHFNLSHSTDLALLALTETGPVGIDLEQKARACELLECETSFCHPEEIAALPNDPTERSSTLLNIWTAKEAALKALGTGLSHPPESVRILNNAAVSNVPLAGIERLTIHHLEGWDFSPRGPVWAGNEFNGNAESVNYDVSLESGSSPPDFWGQRSLPLRDYCAALATTGAVSKIRFMVFDRSISPGKAD